LFQLTNSQNAFKLVFRKKNHLAEICTLTSAFYLVQTIFWTAHALSSGSVGGRRASLAEKAVIDLGYLFSVSARGRRRRVSDAWRWTQVDVSGAGSTHSIYDLRVHVWLQPGLIIHTRRQLLQILTSLHHTHSPARFEEQPPK